MDGKVTTRGTVVHSNDVANVQANKNDHLRFADIHCHCLPSFDDGPKTLTESLLLCEMLSKDGIAVVVATPHQLGRFDGCGEASDIREAVCGLNESLKKSRVAIEILPGSEVRIDERTCQLLKTDRILTLADSGRFILIELPCEVFINIEPLLEELASMDIQPIISHAERISPTIAPPRRVFRWLENSAHMQITAASLLGDFGREVQHRAWRLLASGCGVLVASDSHDTKLRRPRMKIAFERIRDELGHDIANLVCIKNPFRVISGQNVLNNSKSCQQETT